MCSLGSVGMLLRCLKNTDNLLPETDSIIDQILLENHWLQLYCAAYSATSALICLLSAMCV